MMRRLLTALLLVASIGTAQADTVTLAKVLADISALGATGVVNPAALRTVLSELASLPLVGATDDASYSSSTVMVPGASAIAAGRAVEFICSVAGNVSLQFTNSTPHVLPLQIGLSVLPYSAVGINTSGTTATCTYANLP